MLKIAVLVSGGGTNLQAIIDAVESGALTNTEISLVISNKADARALERARNHGIKGVCIRPRDFENRADYDDEMIRVIREAGAELIVLAGFLVVLSEKFVTTFERRIINIHPSLIPSFCGDGFYGLKVHEAALARGVKVSGATVHFVDCGTDTGPIIMQKAVEVMDGDTPEVLQRRIMEQAEWILLPGVIQKVADGEVKIG